MRISSAQALTELEKSLAGDEPLDILRCRRLALRIARAIPDPDAAIFTNESLRAAINAHAEDPCDARERFELLRPAIETLAAEPH